MVKEVEKVDLKKKRATFNLIGKAVVNDESFKIDMKAESSDWNYNSMNLGVDCGEKHGVIYADMMGGYGLERTDNKIYVHGKTSEGRDDFKNRYTISWADRTDEETLDAIGDMCFLTIGIEKDKNGKTVYEKFLSQYDAIAYLKEHLSNGDVINVKGNLKYSEYNGNVQCKKEITSIALSKREEKDFNAYFTQTILLDKDSIGDEDKGKGVIYLNAYVVDYAKKYKGKDLKMPEGSNAKGKNIAFPKTFEYEMDLSNADKAKKIKDKLLKVKKDITEITFNGELIENGTVVTMTMDDLPEDIKELVKIGVYSEQEALLQCTGGSSRERRMVLKTPYINRKEDEAPTIAKEERAYTEEDLAIETIDNDETDREAAEEETVMKTVTVDNSTNEDDELNELLELLQ